MNNRNRSIIALSVLALGGLALAQTTLPFTFSSGTPIKAADINANFQALLTGVNRMGNLTTENNSLNQLTLPNGRFRTGELRAENSLVSESTGETDNPLLRLRAGSPLGDRLRVGGSSSIVAIGRIGYGVIPASGAGVRLMWHPYKVAFRAGGVDGAQWDENNIGFYSWAGGENNTAFGTYSFSMGINNIAEGQASSAIGSRNTVGSQGAGGFASGFNNFVLDFTGTALGNQNTSNGNYAMAMGYRSAAFGDNSVAIGNRATTCSNDPLNVSSTTAATCATSFSGAMVLADGTNTGDYANASANNQFTSRFAGGYRLFTNATTTTGVSVNAGGASWNVISDKNAKADFKPVDVRAVLERVVKMPVTTWRYKEEAGAPRHMGVMAQDFRAAFGLNTSDKTINTVDADGVAFAAIQGLNAKLVAENAALKARDAQLAAENAALKAQLTNILDRLAKLEQNTAE